MDLLVPVLHGLPFNSVNWPQGQTTPPTKTICPFMFLMKKEEKKLQQTFMGSKKYTYMCTCVFACTVCA